MEPFRLNVFLWHHEAPLFLRVRYLPNIQTTSANSYRLQKSGKKLCVFLSLEECVKLYKLMSHWETQLGQALAQSGVSTICPKYSHRTGSELSPSALMLVEPSCDLNLFLQKVQASRDTLLVNCNFVFIVLMRTVGMHHILWLNSIVLNCFVTD